MHLITLFEQEKKGDVIKNCVLEGLLGFSCQQLFGEHSIFMAVIFVIFMLWRYKCYHRLICVNLPQPHNHLTPIVASMKYVLLKHTNWSWQWMQKVNILIINLCHCNTNVWAIDECDYTIILLNYNSNDSIEIGINLIINWWIFHFKSASVINVRDHFSACVKQLNIDVIGITSLVLQSDVRAQTIIHPLAFVIDDTGSSVKLFVQTLITEVEAVGETPEYFVLAQFVDPVHFDNSYSTSLSFISTLNSIVASGGGECPEYGFSGLEAALQFISASTQTFGIDSGINCFNILPNSNEGPATFSLTDAGGIFYSFSKLLYQSLMVVFFILQKYALVMMHHYQIIVNIEIGQYQYHLVQLQLIYTLTVYTMDVSICFDFSIFT